MSLSILSFFLLLLTISLHAQDETPLAIGNLALPPAQQPGPLIGFGENILDQGTIQTFLLGNGYISSRQYSVILTPGVAYGITDNFSVFFNVPLSTSYNQSHSSGFQDVFLQLEYAFYTGLGRCYINQATVVTNVSFPTGSTNKVPATGFGAVAYFLGLTFSHLRTDWIFFTSYGVELPTAAHGNQFGNQYLYQYGFGRNIAYSKDWIVSVIVELDGTYYSHNRIARSRDANSGGNVIYLTPCLWVSNRDWIIQLGAGHTISQHFYGSQANEGYLLAFNIGRTF